MTSDLLPRAKGQLGIPLSRQENSYSCGAAAIRSVLLKLGVDVKEKLLRDLLGTTSEDGTDPRDMIAFLKEIPGLRVDAGPMTVDDLRRAVTFEVIVIIDLQAWSDEAEVDYQTTWNSGHYVVLSGFDRETLFFADPAADVTTTLPMGGLQERWHDEDIDGGRWGNLGISVSLDSILQDNPDWKTLVEAKLKKMSEKTASTSRVAKVFAMKTALDAKKWGPFSFEIDRPKGFKKEWPQEDGTVKKYTYPVDYGYFIGHTGEDEEGLDAFVGDDPTGKIESFLKMKPSEDGETLVPDETKFLVGLTDAERKKVMGLYKPEEIVGLREYEDVYELVATLNAFRDRKKAASRVASRRQLVVSVSRKFLERDRKATHIVIRDVQGTREYLNDVSGGWSKKDYLAIPFELPRAKELAEKFGGEVVPRKSAGRQAKALGPGERILDLNLYPLLKFRQKGNPIESDRCGEVDGKTVCGEGFEYYEALMDSMRRKGLREPIHFAAWGGRPHIVEGHHRLNAAWELKWKKIKTLVDPSITDEMLLKFGLVDP